MPHFHNYPAFKAFHIKMSGLYKMLLLWFPGNRPLRCDSLGNFVVNFHCYYHFSGGSTFLLKCCWLVKKKEQWYPCVDVLRASCTVRCPGCWGWPRGQFAGADPVAGVLGLILWLMCWGWSCGQVAGAGPTAGLLGLARWLAPSGPAWPSSGTLTARCPKVMRMSWCMF